MQALAIALSCLGDPGAGGGDPQLLPFLAAVFLVLLGVGRIAGFCRHHLRRYLSHDEDAVALADLWPADSADGRSLILLTLAVSVLYVAASILVGIGLASDLFFDAPRKVSLFLGLSGGALGVLTAGLLLTANRLARRFDRPAHRVNTAMRERGTNRFEVVLATTLSIFVAGCMAVVPAGPVDCPATEETLTVPAAQSQAPLEVMTSRLPGRSNAAIPPDWNFDRLPSRTNDGTQTVRAEREDAPGLRLDTRTEDTRPGEPDTGVWAQLATAPRLDPTGPRNRLYAELGDGPALRPTFVPRMANSTPVPPPDLFGTIARTTAMAPAIWQVRVENGAGDFGRCLDQGSGCAANAVGWARFVNRSRHLEGHELLTTVNEFVNSTVQFQSDSTLQAVLDDWITPASLVRDLRGDCEDFALAKFWLLEMLGVDRNDLYIVVVQDLVAQMPHAFLAVRSGDQVWLLDSRVNRPLSPQEVDDIVPVISIGNAAAYLHGRPSGPDVPMSDLMEWLAAPHGAARG